MAPLFSKVDPNKLRINVKHKMTLIDAKFDADLINIISEVTNRKTNWSRFFGLPCTLVGGKNEAIVSFHTVGLCSQNW